MILAGDGASRTVNVLVLRHRVAAELLREELTLDLRKTILGGNHATRLVERLHSILWSNAIVAHHKLLVSLLTASHKLNKPGVDAFQCLLAQRLLLRKDTLAFIFQVEHFFYRLPFLIDIKHASFVAVLSIGLNRECYGKSLAGELSEEPLARGVGPEVGSVQQTPVVFIAVVHYVLHPSHIAASLESGNRVSVLVEVAPAHELLHVLYLDVVGVDGLDVAKQVLGQRAAVGIAGLTALGLREVRTFQ